MELRDIKIKDLFKPRYALIVEIINVPTAIIWESDPHPVIKRLPFKRSLDITYKEFSNYLYKRFPTNLRICGSHYVITHLDGVGGSVLSHNIKNAIVIGKKDLL
ncbi:MAG: hypothetical protein WC679_02180 [Bacteroidales bacterium]|jgi:hypothetical protein